MARLRTRIILSVAIVVVILSVSTVFLVVLPSLRTSTSTGMQYLQECPESWDSLVSDYTNSSGLESFAAIAISPNTTANICTEYSSDGPAPVTVILNPAIYFQNNMSVVPVNLIRIVPTPGGIVAPGARGLSPSPVTYVIYTLNVSASAKGFYMLYLPGICPLMPVAVGYSQINYSDFANGWQNRGECVALAFFGGFFSADNISLVFSYVP